MVPGVEVIQNQGNWLYQPDRIVQSIKDNDTTYSEQPRAFRYIYPLNIQSRTASTSNPKGKEYEILKRRFEEAKGVTQPISAFKAFFKL